MAILDLDHINIQTTDLAKTQAFFTDVLGLTVGWRPDFEFPGTWLYAGEKDVVHLVGVRRERTPSQGSSLDHFAFTIDDFEDARRRLNAAGIEYRETAAPNGGIRQFFLTEANGVTIELNCRNAG
jgi:catechol 2,3-dioxygenase-like lactoylglutathione lyase family enzyme